MLTAEPGFVALHGTLDRAGDLSDDEKWRAVLTRDENLDGMFVFGVRSTGIYCRPSCPARHAAKGRIVFFSRSIEAERLGFRPCQRCRPDQTTPSPRAKLVDQACRYIEANLQRKLTLSVLSSQLGLSPSHFQRTFKRVLGISPRQYVESCRLAKMKRFLRKGETVNNSLYNAGFTSRSRVYENPGRLGVNPGALRRGGEGMQIRYSILDSHLGRVLVASTERGLCSVCIGDSDKAVERTLAEDFSSASLHRDDRGMKTWTDAFAGYLRGEQFTRDLPLDVKATAFQSRVWKMIQSIPYGKTDTYSGLAMKLGKPEATRAVAQACATNPVALIIPCHRVVGKDGELHGYRWGNKRKQALLELEKESSQTTSRETTR